MHFALILAPKHGAVMSNDTAVNLITAPNSLPRGALTTPIFGLNQSAIYSFLQSPKTLLIQ